MKIDIVYTWCDGSEEKFMLQQNELRLKLGMPIKENTKVDFSDPLDYTKRSQDNDELLYSLRSVEKYAPWVNHIYIITNNQKPKWLKESEKISIIDQSLIIPKEIQPVFNSVAIEQYITNIPNLSECFLYFCDDMFLNRRVKPGYFFKDGKPIVWICNRNEFDFSGFWEQTVFNAYELVMKKHKKYIPFFFTHHGVDAYSKTILKEIFQQYPEIFERNNTPFRSSNNIQRILWSYEMVYYYKCPLKKDYTFTKKIRKLYAIIFRKNVFWNHYCTSVRNSFVFSLNLFLKKTYCFCLNNICGNEAEYAKKYLNKRFPKKSEFEE